MQKLLLVNLMIENSDKRVFYLMKPQGDKGQYIVDQHFKAMRCKLQSSVPTAYTEAYVMKIVGTLASMH